MRVRYGRWTGQQDPFPVDVAPDDVLEQVADDLLGGHDADHALARLLQRGMSGRQRVAGLDDLRRRVEEARRRELSRMGLEGPLRAVAERLTEIVGQERAALDLAPSDPANPDAVSDRHAQLDALPTDPAGQLAALDDYDWFDARAERAYRDLVSELRRDVAQAAFGQLAGAIGSMDPADLERLQALLGELNALAARAERGEDVAEDFARFKERYGDMLPPADTLEELLEELARRMAALSSLLAGMDPQQRAQLAEMASRLLGDMDLQFQAGQLSQRLQSMFPELGWGEGVPGAMPDGPESGGLSETVDWVERLQEYGDLGDALGQDYPGARLEDVDSEALRRILGEDAARDLEALREVERILEEAGVAQRHHGRLELTPRGIRRLGERSLARIYDRAISGAVGSHDARGAGGDGELTGATRPLQFGDPFRLDVGKTIRNAVMRGAGTVRGEVAKAGRSSPEGHAVGAPPPGRSPARPPSLSGRAPTALRPMRVAVEAGDFELAEAERRVRAATVLLLDMSFSMPLRGNWVPAKRVALALHSLISGKFPEDRFYIVGFSDYARRLQPRDLLATGWERVYGTNMQHAFMIARRLLGAHPDAEQQVIMVTDGEPTAHLEGDVPMFAWPPEPRTLRATLAESARLTRTGATLNVFLLDHDPGAAAFVEHMVGACGGRIFYPDLADLGHLVVRDFLAGRRRA